MILKVPSPGPVFFNFHLKGPVGSQGSPIKGFGFTAFWLVVGVVPKWSKQILRSKRKEFPFHLKSDIICWKTGERHDWALMTPSGSLVREEMAQHLEPDVRHDRAPVPPSRKPKQRNLPKCRKQSRWNQNQRHQWRCSDLRLLKTAEMDWNGWNVPDFSWIGHPWNDWLEAYLKQPHVHRRIMKDWKLLEFHRAHSYSWIFDAYPSRICFKMRWPIQSISVLVYAGSKFQYVFVL